MVGIRSEIRGAPGGRTRYPITMRRIKLEAPIDVKAIIRITGLIVGGNSRALNVHPSCAGSQGGVSRADQIYKINGGKLIKSAWAVRIISCLETKSNLLGGDSGGRQGGDHIFAEKFGPTGFATLYCSASLEAAENK